MERKTLFSNLLIADTTGRILFLKRSATVKFAPLKWCLPGGHMEVYESPDEAALREALEETGLDFTKEFRPQRVGIYQNSKAIMYYFLVQVADPSAYGVLHLDMSEHQNYVWLTFSEALKQSSNLKLDFMLDLESHLQNIAYGVNTPSTV